jgi:hypothetical protein
MKLKYKNILQLKEIVIKNGLIKTFIKKILIDYEY